MPKKEADTNIEISTIKLTDIEEADYNPRIMSDNEKLKLRNSIDTFGVVDPIIINLKNNRIIGGHQRYNALIDIMMEDHNFTEQEMILIKLGDIGWVFPSTDLKLEDENYEKALNLALNKISGNWEYQKLNVLLEDLKDTDMDLTITGFDNPSLDFIDFDKYDNLLFNNEEEDFNDEEEGLTEFENMTLDSIRTQYKCPKCGYEWNGNAN